MLTSRKLLLLSLLVFAFTTAVNSQTILSGKVTDTSNAQRLPLASVVVLRAQDSIIQAYTWTDGAGRFSLRSIPVGKHLLVVSQSGYAEFSTEFQTSSNQEIMDFGEVIMSTKIKLLEAVVVRQQVAAIRMRGDTMEYNADSFRLERNATAEELLRKLPGLTVDRGGNITAYGQKVRRVLVDGEEFFGDDPTLTTRTLKADMVDKVQLYDRQASSGSTPAGSIASKEKTINLQLKESSRNGSFGKLHTGWGTSPYFEHQGMYNRFRKRMKFSAYGISNNTGTVGLEWRDLDKYGIKEAVASTLQGGISTWVGDYEGRGIPKVLTGGLQYSNTWQERNNLNANAKASRLQVNGDAVTTSQFVLPGGQNNFTQRERFKNVNLKSQGVIQSRVAIDSFTTVNTTVEGYQSQRKVAQEFFWNTLNDKGDTLNVGSRLLNNQDREEQLFGRSSIERKSRKAGRAIFMELQGAINAIRSDGQVQSRINTFITVVPDTLLVDFNRKVRGDFNRLGAQMKWTEPLGKGTTFSILYEGTTDNNHAIIETFQRDNRGEYSLKDSLLSSDYRFNRTSHQFGAFANHSSKKLLYSFGALLNTQRFAQLNQFNGARLQRNFFSVNPRTEWVYLFSQQKKVNFYYNGNLLPPPLFQIQPVVNNIDPLNIFIGNPLLRPSFAHTMGIGYNRYKPVNRSYIFSNANYYVERNRVSTAVQVDSSGKNTYQFVNVDGYQRGWGYLGIGKEFNKNTNGGLNLGLNRETNISFINGQKNKLKSSSIEFEGYFNLAREGVFQSGIRTKSTFFLNSATVTQIAEQFRHYWLHEVNPSIEFFLPYKLRLHTDANYFLRPEVPSVSRSLDAFVWNAWIAKSFLNNSIWLRLACRDILNQNNGFTATSSGNVVTQSNFSLIQRYGMITLTWDFSKSRGAATAAKNQ